MPFCVPLIDRNPDLKALIDHHLDRKRPMKRRLLDDIQHFFKVKQERDNFYGITSPVIAS